MKCLSSIPKVAIASIEISTNYGANVVQFYFNGRWPKKKNWSLDNLPFRNEWVLIVDCDERITPELWDEIATVIQDPNYNGYYLNRRRLLPRTVDPLWWQVSRLESALI
jgi:hypothetical protein